MAKPCKYLTGYEMCLIPSVVPMPSRGLRQEPSQNWVGESRLPFPIPPRTPQLLTKKGSTLS